MMIYQSQYVPFLRLLAGVPIVDADHTPHFQSLAHYLLKCFGEQGLLNDMSKDEINLAATLSVYHDIGKSMLRPTLLYKTGPLSKAEQEQVKSHTEWGEFLIDLTIPELRGTATHRFACEICRYHHERWDGSGYPDGLRGDEIPRYVQVIALADCYDALVAPRSYKPPVPHRKAAGMILSGECGAFCPALLKAFAGCADWVQIVVYGKESDPSGC